MSPTEEFLKIPGLHVCLCSQQQKYPKIHQATRKQQQTRKRKETPSHLMKLRLSPSLSITVSLLLIPAIINAQAPDPKNDAICPLEQPELGVGPCWDESNGILCRYDSFTCPGYPDDIIYRANCGCDSGAADCAVSLVICPDVEPATSCPLLAEEQPSTGDACDFSGKCRYNAFVCPGFNDKDGIIFLNQCECDQVTNQFTCAEIAVDCPPIDTDCPLESPLVTDDFLCGVNGLECNFDPFGCPSGDGSALFTTSCTCEDSQFICAQALPVCNDIPEPEPPATSCPLLSEEQPSTGDACDFSGKCRYNAFVCPGNNDKDDIIFLNQCECDQVTNQFTCDEIAVDCPPIDTDCPFESPLVTEEDFMCGVNGLECNFDPFGCPSGDGSALFTTSCTCDSSQFICTQALPVCNDLDIPEPEPPATSCPLSGEQPSTGDACDFDEETRCRYNPFNCPGFQEPEDVAFLKTCQCDAVTKQFVCSEVSVKCPAAPDDFECPLATVNDGDMCSSSGQECNYEPVGCPGRTDDAVFSRKCTCDGTRFQCQFTFVVCNFICFSGDTMVTVQDERGVIPMTDIVLGDMVQVDEAGRFEPIYSFGHLNAKAEGEFVEIQLDDNQDAPLRASRQHLVWEATRGEFVPASSLRVGDKLSGERTIQSIHPNVKALGVFAPFTPSGTIVVNGVVASCYVSLNDDDDESNTLLGVSHHWMAHAFEFPHRLACHYMGQCLDETYTEDGVSTWVAIPLQWSLWMLEQPIVARTVFLLCAIALFSVSSAVEWCVLNWILVLPAGLLMYRLTASIKKVKKL